MDRQLGTPQEGRADDRLLTALQALLSRDISDAQDWDDLAERLRPHGYEVRLSGDDIVLFKSSCGTRICTGVELDVSYAGLVKRFGVALRGPADTETTLGVMPAGNIDPTRQAVLKTHFSTAKSWPDLINRLACEGMELRCLGTSLGIYISATGRHLCNSETIGADVQTLKNRFDMPVPSFVAPSLPKAETCGDRVNLT